MKIYTKTGDKGETSLFDGTRVTKDNLRIEAYGTIDELNSYLGLLTTFEIPQDLKEKLTKILNILFQACTDLATPMESEVQREISRIDENHPKILEQFIDEYNEKLPELKNFILPGGSTESAHTHIARAVCRRAERRVVELSLSEKINQNIIIFLNRLSDFLFVVARYINYSKGFNDNVWKFEK